MNKYRRIKYEDRCQIYALSKRGSSLNSARSERSAGMIRLVGLRGLEMLQRNVTDGGHFGSYRCGCRNVDRDVSRLRPIQHWLFTGIVIRDRTTSIWIANPGVMLDRYRQIFTCRTVGYNAN
jgi:hypothetical protein